MTVYDRLAHKYNPSNATTYDWLRRNNQPAFYALIVMRSQIAHLGFDFNGGLDCTPYRKARLKGTN